MKFRKDYLKNKKFLRGLGYALFFAIVGFSARSLVGVSCLHTGLHYINPDLFCGKEYVVSKNAYGSLKEKLLIFFEEKKQTGEISDISFFFRDLQDGPTLGINEHETYAPASLLKLPVFLTYLKVGEEVPDFFGTKLAFQESTEHMEQYFPPTKSIEQNKQYSLSELLDAMIMYSDNRAYYVLINYIKMIQPEGMDLIKNTFVDLGILTPSSFADQTISVKAYASLFSQLYFNAFFSQRETSERALDTLTRTDFNQGIVTGIPSKVKVAHKFGERSDLPGGEVQLHDCGIVYYPKNPYLVCVMTKGRNFKELSKVIGEVSAMVYQEFHSRSL